MRPQGEVGRSSSWLLDYGQELDANSEHGSQGRGVRSDVGSLALVLVYLRRFSSDWEVFCFSGGLQWGKERRS